MGVYRKCLAVVYTVSTYVISIRPQFLVGQLAPFIFLLNSDFSAHKNSVSQLFCFVRCKFIFLFAMYFLGLGDKFSRKYGLSISGFISLVGLILLAASAVYIWLVYFVLFVL